MTLDLVVLNPLIALIAGILILLVPRLLNFVVAIYLLLIFSIWLHWLPVLGTNSGGGFLDQLVWNALEFVRQNLNLCFG